MFEIGRESEAGYVNEQVEEHTTGGRKRNERNFEVKIKETFEISQ